MRRSEHDSLAQLAEHLTFNQGVRGSNPRWITNMNRDSFESLFFFLKRNFKYVNFELINDKEVLKHGICME